MSSITAMAFARCPSADGRPTTLIPGVFFSSSSKPFVRSWTEATVGWSMMRILPWPFR
jgi:hypothetical protein